MTVWGYLSPKICFISTLFLSLGQIAEMNSCFVTQDIVDIY